MDKVFITEEEKTQLSNLRTQEDDLIVSLGQVEYQLQSLQLRKDALKQRMVTLRGEYDSYGKTLNEKYGNGNVDLNTGEFVKS